MLLTQTNDWGWTYTNYGDPSGAPGTAVVASTSSADPTYYQVASSSDVANDVHFATFQVFRTQNTNGDNSSLMTIGIDPTGGTSYSDVIENIIVGGAHSLPGYASGLIFSFPLFIKAGSSVAVKLRRIGTSPSPSVALKMYGLPSRPELVKSSAQIVTVGSVTTASSIGEIFTPANGSFSSWEALGSTTPFSTFFWQFGVQLADTEIAAHYGLFQLGYGDGTSGGTRIICERRYFWETAERCVLVDPVSSTLDGGACVPSGAQLYIRGWVNIAPETDYNATAIGLG